MPRDTPTSPPGFDLPADGRGCDPEAAANGPPDPDRWRRGRWAMLLGGQSPWAALQAWEDWAFHLAISPDRQLGLWRRAMAASGALWVQALGGGQRDWAFVPDPKDRRFREASWAAFPFCLLAQAQLALEAQWAAAASDVRGVEEHHARRVEFLGRFALNALAPINFPWTNPEVLAAAYRTGGANFARGAALFLEDFGRLARNEKLKGLEDFKVGETMAVTEGEVIFRNALMELIQYAPKTAQVHREPILIVPAWIMKYYILDPTPANSLVRHLVEQGFTVFIISWKNPGAELRETSFEDYRRMGVMAAIEAISEVAPGEKLHAVGYCLGGTVLAIAAAAMNRDGDDRLASLTLLAAQTDFEQAGELMLFIDESQLALLEDMMLVKGYLDARQMSGAFFALRSNEMLYSKFVERYLLAAPRPPGDIDAWLADPTRMPARMHSEYLRRLFLENRFAHGSYDVDGRTVALKDLRTPLFALGAERDHIAPWRSVYKLALYGSADMTFALTGGGHNTSVVSPPGKPGAYYRVGTFKAFAPYVDPDVWMAATPKRDGSWWPEWLRWLERNSSGRPAAPPPMGRPGAVPATLAPAPGSYVFET